MDTDGIYFGTVNNLSPHCPNWMGKKAGGPGEKRVFAGVFESTRALKTEIYR